MLTDDVKRDIKIHYVSEFKEVFALLFGKENAESTEIDSRIEVAGQVGV